MLLGQLLIRLLDSSLRRRVAAETIAISFDLLLEQGPVMALGEIVGTKRGEARCIPAQDNHFHRASPERRQQFCHADAVILLVCARWSPQTPRTVQNIDQPRVLRSGFRQSAP